jgi:1,4-dihydroxy-2-naphthoate octaprenyltransferase
MPTKPLPVLTKQSTASSAFVEYVLATRPWSFTAAIIPVLVVSAVVGADLLSLAFARCLIMAVAIQAGANLTNTYYDFANKVDTKVGGERTLVDDKVSATGVVVLSVICYLVGIASVMPVFLESTDNSQLVAIFGVGCLLAFFYTATPVGLKYRALGDITIFVCFGPLLMQCTSILLTGTTRTDLYLYSVPIGCLTEAILHANNARDIEADSRAKATTLATMIGLDNSYWVYAALFAGSFLSVLVISYQFHWGAVAAFLTVPLALDLLKHYRENKMQELPEETAKMHLPFGVLLWLGIRLTEEGISGVSGIA